MQAKVIFVLILLVYMSVSCSSEDNNKNPDYSKEFNDTTFACIFEKSAPQNLEINEGLISQHAQTIRVIRGGECVAIVKLGEPVTVAQAEREEPWGYFQNPVIYRGDNTNNLIVKWAMQADSHLVYGQDSNGRLMSTDEGETWVPLDADYYNKKRDRVELKCGDVLQVKNPSSKNVRDYDFFPKSVNENPIGDQKYDFYFESELPEELQGAYLDYWHQESGDTTRIHAKLKDSELLRYSIDGIMPIVWWGNIKELEDGSLLTGVYGGYYLNPNGNVLRGGISFYKSSDSGRNWDLIGRIPYQKSDNDDPNTYLFDGSDGFNEPTFEILKDGTYICVMRNSSWSLPMVKTFSKDKGKTWSTPVPITPSGVKPRLMLMNNGVLVLAAGRPGIQLRFNLNGDGIAWTEPIDMLPFIDSEGEIKSTRETCGYADMLPFNNDSFYIVYSDFKSKDSNGDERKSILFRKVTVKVK